MRHAWPCVMRSSTKGVLNALTQTQHRSECVAWTMRTEWTLPVRKRGVGCKNNVSKADS